MTKTECICELKWLRDVYAGMRKEYGSCVEALDMAINALEQAAWIPCSERLPEDGDKVLCMTKTKKGNLNHVVGYHYSGGWACGMNRNVIAWMPLPEPYEEGE